LATALIHLMPGFEIFIGDDIIRRIGISRESLRPSNSLN
jgi:hypothetical protein